MCRLSRDTESPYFKEYHPQIPQMTQITISSRGLFRDIGGLMSRHALLLFIALNIMTFSLSGLTASASHIGGGDQNPNLKTQRQKQVARGLYLQPG